MSLNRRKFLETSGKGIVGGLAGLVGVATGIISLSNTAFAGSKKCKIYTYDYWIDKNGDNMWEKSEIKEKDKFMISERIEIAVETKGYKGAKADTKVSNASGEIVFHVTNTISYDYGVTRPEFPRSKERTRGQYTITVEIDDIIKATKEITIL